MELLVGRLSIILRVYGILVDFEYSFGECGWLVCRLSQCIQESSLIDFMN